MTENEQTVEDLLIEQERIIKILHDAPKVLIGAEEVARDLANQDGLYSPEAVIQNINKAIQKP